MLGAGSVFVANGSLSIGALIAFLLYLNLFFAPIQQLSQVFDSYQQARVAIDRITELLDTPTTVPPPAEPVPVPALRGEVDVRRRALPLPNGDRRSAARRRLRIAPGETVALVGETGAGKCTVMKLVARFYDATVGARVRRRRAGERLRPGRVPPAARRRAAGGVPVLGHDPRQHRVRPRRRDRRRGRGRGRARSARTTSSRRCPAATSSG